MFLFRAVLLINIVYYKALAILCKLVIPIKQLSNSIQYIVVQFNTWFEFYFIFVFGYVLYDNELETKENHIKPQHIYKTEQTRIDYMFIFEFLSLNVEHRRKSSMIV